MGSSPGGPTPSEWPSSFRPALFSSELGQLEDRSPGLAEKSPWPLPVWAAGGGLTAEREVAPQTSQLGKPRLRKSWGFTQKLLCPPFPIPEGVPRGKPSERLGSCGPCGVHGDTAAPTFPAWTPHPLWLLLPPPAPLGGLCSWLVGSGGGETEPLSQQLTQRPLRGLWVVRCWVSLSY